jgi:hypothetical protein
VNSSIAAQRLHHQHIIGPRRRRAADVVAALGAVQAQEFPAAKWALALRMPEGTTDAQLDRAFNEGRILRTHVMRPTWHFVTPADIRWMLELTAPRLRRILTYYARQNDLDRPTLVRGVSVFERALAEGRFLTRAELGAELARVGIEATGVRLGHLAMQAEIDGVICSGPRRGNQHTYGLVSERAPNARRLSRDEALGTLTARFFTSHAPATIRDFTWWSGLTAADAKRGLEISKARREPIDALTYWSIDSDGRQPSASGGVHLLPVYDEYLVAYRDRVAVPHLAISTRSQPRGATVFQHALVIGGQVAGTWKPTRVVRGAGVEVAPVRRLTAAERRALADAASRYERFLGVPVSLAIA